PPVAPGGGRGGLAAGLATGPGRTRGRLEPAGPVLSPGARGRGPPPGVAAVRGGARPPRPRAIAPRTRPPGRAPPRPWLAREVVCPGGPGASRRPPLDPGDGAGPGPRQPDRAGPGPAARGRAPPPWPPRVVGRPADGARRVGPGRRHDGGPRPPPPGPR